MTGRNRLLSSEKSVAFDGQNEIDVNVVEEESLTEISTNGSLKSFSNSSIPSNSSIETRKLNMSSIAIAEKDDPRKFRIYRPLNCEQSDSMIYYRCSKCESLEKKGGIRSKHYKPYVKTLNGKLIGNAHPVHHPSCRAVTKEIQELQEMDRACRAKIKASCLAREHSEKLEGHAFEQSSDIDFQSNCSLLKRPKRMNIKFGASSHDINESELSEVDHLLSPNLQNSVDNLCDDLFRFISEASINDAAQTTNQIGIYPTATSLLSKSIGYSSLIVPEPDGMYVRIYDADDKLADKEVSCYHCSQCDDLYQKSDNDSMRTVLKAENDLVIDYPTHHAECSPTSLESLRQLGDDLKNFCVVANHRIISLKTVLESEFDVFHEPDEDFLIGGSDEQSWDTTIVDEGIVINPASVSKPQEQRCFCRRLYEENLELYQEMLRSVDEMRSMVNEMKHISGANAEYYIDDSQILEEGDNSTLNDDSSLAEQPSEQFDDKEEMSSTVFLSEQGTSKQDDETSLNGDNTSINTMAMPLSRKRNRRIWTLVSGDGHDFRCNACKRIIKCCSPTNITRHYANNHPEVLKTEEIPVDVAKESIEPVLEENFKDAMVTANDIPMSSGTRMNTGKIDWSSPSIQKILEKIASRELTEKMGTDMIAYKTGCQLSQSTVRKRVHCLLEDRFGTYSLSKKNNAIMAQPLQVNDINETVTYVGVDNAIGGRKKLMKLDGKKNREQQLSEGTGSSLPVPPIPRQVRSLRLSRSSIVIPEKDDPSKVRIYRCSAYGRGASAAERTKRYFAHIKTKDGRIIGNAYPEHLPECKPVPKEVQQLQEIDRACRARIQAGNLTPEAARKLGALVAQKNRELKRHIKDDDTFPDKWKSLPKKYSRLCHQAERMRKQKNRQLLRMMKNEQGDGETEEDQSGVAHEAEIMSGRFKHPPLIIFEPDGQAARIYRINGKSDKLGIVYYRCSKCDVLCRRHRRMGNVEGMTRATVKVEQNEILENMYPAHHDECEVFTLDMVKNLAENLDRFYFAKDYESIIHDSAKTDLRFADGTLISKNQIPIVSAVEHVEDDVVVDISNVANTEEVDDDAWETILNEDVLNVRAEDHEGPIGSTCQGYYEANMALRRDMVRCLEEMRTLRTEMRNMLEEGKLQYVEVDDDHYEEIIVDEND
ncbi:unnamed protein product [Litomosoides sigmodontis]|uniref:RYYR-CCHC domain-containing protein n=1 Tax=Litomosoides sigmodontis TaxID=42156 RepID=A0A3P6U3S3_LITSI|nr:unnamed protein product [Litomosoides sigmodontis]VDK88675.1 unnamed protein product [Litomosoides sigmodontis]